MTGNETGLLTLMDSGQVPENIPHFPQPARSLRDLSTALQAVLTEEHNHRALVIDSLTCIEEMLCQHVCDTTFKGSWDDFNDFGADKALRQVGAAWDQVLNQLDRIQERGIGVLTICHSLVTNFKNPLGPDYERWTALSKYSWARVYKWADIVLFGGFEEVVTKRNRKQSDAEGKGKAVGGEVRMLFTERRSAFDAKNRAGLPPVIECGSSAEEAWANFQAALRAAKEK
jgi:hypothetical protein